MSPAPPPSAPPGTPPGRTGRWWLLWCVLAVLLVGPAALAPSPAALLAAVPAWVAVSAALTGWAPARLPAAGCLVAALSLLVDPLYRGDKDFVALWFLPELAALLVLLARGIRRAPVRQAVPVGALTAAAVLLLPLRFLSADPGADWPAVATASALLLFPLAGAATTGLALRSVARRRRHAVERARREQRLRVAADLHDFVAHEVTGMLLEVQAAQVSGYGPAETRELLGRLEESGLRALDSMDRTVGALRGPSDGGAADGGPSGEARRYGLADLAELVGRFSAAGTARVRLRLADGLAGTLPPEVEETAHRVVLEALTNVRRHAGPSPEVEVEVEVETAATGGDGAGGQALRVTVTDDGGTGGRRRDRRSGGGTGLPVLAERAAALGGELTAGGRGTGWRVRVLLPG